MRRTFSSDHCFFFFFFFFRKLCKINLSKSAAKLVRGKNPILRDVFHATFVDVELQRSRREKHVVGPLRLESCASHRQRARCFGMFRKMRKKVGGPGPTPRRYGSFQARARQNARRSGRARATIPTTRRHFLPRGKSRGKSRHEMIYRLQQFWSFSAGRRVPKGGLVSPATAQRIN